MIDGLPFVVSNDVRILPGCQVYLSGFRMHPSGTFFIASILSVAATGMLNWVFLLSRSMVELRRALQENAIARATLLNARYDKQEVCSSLLCFSHLSAGS